MAKALATAAVIVGVAVAGFATAGAAWAVAGVASIGAAASSIGATVLFGSVTAGQVISGAALAAGLFGALDKPAAPTVGQTDAGSQIEFKADPHAPIPYIMGRAGAGGNLVFDDTAGSKSAYLDQVIVWSLGPVQEIEALFANDVALGFPDDGGEGQDGFYIHKMWRKNQLGSDREPLLVSSTVQTAGGVPSEWTDAHRLSGYAASWTSQLYDTTVYSGGPVTWRAVLKGVMVYDPRLDDTYPGGSGPQRSGDESTWGYSQNPYLHALTYLIGRKKNGKHVLGCGIPISSIDVAAYVQGANVADANGWVVGGGIYSSDDKWQSLKAILQCGAGMPLKLGAKVSCFVNAPRVSLATLTAADVIDDVAITGSQPRLQRINTVWPTWPQEAQNWQTVAGDAPITVPDYYAIDGGERSTNITYQLVPDATQVGVLARYDIEDAREFGPCTFPCKPKWLGYRPGDCITADEPEWGLNGQKMLILDRQVDPSTLVVTLTCRSETDGKHPFALGQTNVAPLTPGLTGVDRLLTTPEDGAWSAEGELLDGPDGSIPAIVIIGAVENPFVQAVIADWGLVAEDETISDWQSQDWPASATRLVVTAVQPGSRYRVHIRYRTIGGASDPTAFTDLGTVTVGALTANDVNNVGGIPVDQVLLAIQAGEALLHHVEGVEDTANAAITAYLAAQDAAVTTALADASSSLTAVTTETANRTAAISAAVSTVTAAYTAADSGLTATITSAQATANAAAAASATETTNRVAALAAVSSTVSSNTASIGTLSASVSSNASAIANVAGQVYGSYTLSVQAGNVITGIELLSAYGPSTISAFIVHADYFQIAPAGYSPVRPFFYDAGSGTLFSDTITVRNGNIQNLAVDHLKIYGGSVSYSNVVSNAGPFSGGGEILNMSFYTPDYATVYALFTGKQDYEGITPCSWGATIDIDGAAINSTGGGAGYTDSMSLAASEVSVGPGWHSVQAFWSGGNPSLLLRGAVLFLLAIYK